MVKVYLFLMLQVPLLLYAQDLDNVVLGKPTVASSTHRTVTPGGAVDGQYTSSTRWVSQTTVDEDTDPDVHWLDIELLSLFEVSSFFLSYHHYQEEQPLSFRFLVLDPLTGEFVEASQNPNLTLANDTVGYLAEGRGPDAIVFVDTFPQSYQTNRIRFEFTTLDGLRARFYELEVYGKQVKGPDAPTNLTFKPKFEGLANKELEISWTDNSSDEAKFVITKGALSGDQTVRVIATLEADETSFVDTEFDQYFGASYVYTVAALNAAGAASTDLVDTVSFNNPYNIALGKSVWANSSSDDRGPISVVTDGLKSSNSNPDRWQNLRDSELPDTIAVDLDSLHTGVNAFAMFTGWDGLNTSPRRFDVLVRNADITDSIHMDTAISVTGNTDGSFFSFFDKPYNTDSVVLLVYERDGPFVRLKELEIYQWPEDITWDGAAWSNGTGPNGFSKVFINGNITVNTLLTGSEITVAEGVVVEVDQGGDLYANGERHTYSNSDQGVLGDMINNGQIRQLPGGIVRWDGDFTGNDVLIPGVPNLVEPMVSFTETDTTITLKWEDTADDETRFLVERKDGNYLDLNDTMGWHIDTLGWQLIATVDLQPLTGDTVEYVDNISGFVIGRRYQYRVTAASFLDSSRTSDVKKIAAPREGNLAFKKPTSAKDKAGNNESGNAVDGDIFSIGSRWVNNNNLPTWWSVDLEAVYSIDSVVFYINDGGDEFGNPLDSFAIQAWDGFEWVDVLVQGQNKDSIYRAHFGANQFVSSQIRLNVLTAAGDNYVRLLEFEAFGAEYDLAAPSGLMATVNATNQDTTIDLTWTNNAGSSTGVIVIRSENGGAFEKLDTLSADATTYSDGNLQENSDYKYKVFVVDGIGSSLTSNEVAVTTKPVPQSPSGLVVDTLDNGFDRLQISFIDNDSIEDGFAIERSLDGTTFEEVARIEADDTLFLDGGLKPNTEYFYRVAAFNLRGSSQYSNVASNTTVQVIPAAPQNLGSTEQTSTSITLTWEDTTDNVVGYYLWRKTSLDGAFASIDTIDSGVTTYVDSNGLTPETEYSYRMKAFNERGVSVLFSNVLTIGTKAPVPGAPQGASATTNSSTEITVSWTIGTGTVTGHRVERKEGSNFVEVQKVAATATSFKVRNLNPETEYTFRVVAVNEAGDSEPSDEVTATTQKGVIKSAVTSNFKIYPNPFSESVKFEFPKGSSDVAVMISDMFGREITNLSLGTSNSITWNGTDENGVKLPRGLYLMNIRIKDGQFTQRLILE